MKMKQWAFFYTQCQSCQGKNGKTPLQREHIALGLCNACHQQLPKEIKKVFAIKNKIVKNRYELTRWKALQAVEGLFSE